MSPFGNKCEINANIFFFLFGWFYAMNLALPKIFIWNKNQQELIKQQ